MAALRGFAAVPLSHRRPEVDGTSVVAGAVPSAGATNGSGTVLRGMSAVTKRQEGIPVAALPPGLGTAPATTEVRPRVGQVDSVAGGIDPGGFHFALPGFLTHHRVTSFAQELAPPDTAHLSAWLVDAAAVGAILLVFLKIIDHFKRKPSLEQELEKLLRQIRAELNQIRHEQASHLSEVRGRVEGAHQRVDLLTHDLNNKLQRLPGEIVDLLHKTGVTPRPHL
jgi:hypothetical protein